MRRWIAAIATIGIVTAGLVAFDTVVAQPPAAEAAGAQDFNPGNIISDTVFFNNKTMALAEIQSFLDAKVPRCDTGYTCLKDYWQATPSRPADAGRCAAYAANRHETAAQTIYKVATACRINPQVLLVLLEKEQSLITDTWPGARQYRSAAGYGCPDTAACDSEYYGFFNQVYQAARQFQKYATDDYFSWFPVGRASNIQYHPDPACGTRRVTIENKATAGLYYYTPYTPNAAALTAGYGLGDGCSAYGNRNFFNLFTDWFGSTQGFAVDSKLKSLYDRTGGSTGLLGYAVNAAQAYKDGGIGQQFEKGWGFWSPTTGAYRTSGGIGNAYLKSGGPNGALGYPLADMVAPTKGGYSQEFQNGGIYWTTGTATHESLGAIYTSYKALGGPAGLLGYPLVSSQNETGGTSQAFQNGTIYWSAKTGGVSVPKNAVGTYLAAGGPGGKLGYPIAEAFSDNNGASRSVFEHGFIYWSGTGKPTMELSVAAEVNRVYGDNRYQTAVSISQNGFPDTAPIVYVATGLDFPDALSASAAAAHKGGPLLLTKTNSLPAAVKTEIQRLQPQKIVVAGSAAVVSDGVFKQLQALVPNTKRFGGADRYETSRLIIADAFSSSDTAYVATGKDFPDALSASAAAGLMDAPVVLVKGTAGTLNKATANALDRLGVTKTIIAGSEAVVSAGIQRSLNDMMPTVRQAGTDRYGTSRAINKAAFPTTDRVFLATGVMFPDALAGAALAGRVGSPVYVVKGQCLPAAVLKDIRMSGATQITLLGSEGVLSQGIADLNQCQG